MIFWKEKNVQFCIKDNTNNYFHIILRLFDVLPNFPITTSETMRNYYLLTWHIRIASQVAEQLKS